MMATFATKAQKQLYMKFVCKFLLDSSKPIRILIYELVWLAEMTVNLRKNLLKTSCTNVRLLLWPKLPTYFDDVMTIENNRQVRVNVDATLVAIFRMRWHIRSKGFFFHHIIWHWPRWHWFDYEANIYLFPTFDWSECWEKCISCHIR